MHRISRRRYTDDFKAQAIVLAESVGRAKAARQLDLSVKTLGNWLEIEQGSELVRVEFRASGDSLRMAGSAQQGTDYREVLARF